jgi:hypothetical protein
MKICWENIFTVRQSPRRATILGKEILAVFILEDELNVLC